MWGCRAAEHASQLAISIALLCEVSQEPEPSCLCVYDHLPARFFFFGLGKKNFDLGFFFFNCVVHQHIRAASHHKNFFFAHHIVGDVFLKLGIFFT